MTARTLLLLALVPALAACGGSGGKVKSTPAKPSAAKPSLTPAKRPLRTPLTTPPPAARVQSLPGVDGVIGAAPADLIRQFGAPRLDTSEGDARKLQFVGTACVLDVYLYPPERGREVQATYVDARRASDGQDVDRAACISALRKR